MKKLLTLILGIILTASVYGATANEQVQITGTVPAYAAIQATDTLLDLGTLTPNLESSVSTTITEYSNTSYSVSLTVENDGNLLLDTETFNGSTPDEALIPLTVEYDTTTTRIRTPAVGVEYTLTVRATTDNSDWYGSYSTNVNLVLQTN